MQSAESFYSALATGNPQSIQTATAPATQQIAQNYQSAIKNIQQTMPRGGAQDLAVQQAQISEAGQIGSTQANAYLGAFQSLAGLGQSGIGLSQNSITQALSAFSGASQSNMALGQLQNQGKAETLSFLGGLGSSAATGAGLALGCWLAELVFGETSLHTARLRVYLNLVWAKRSRIGRWTMALYLRYGRWLAGQARKRHWLRRLITPIFLYADRNAARWERERIQELRELGVL